MGPVHLHLSPVPGCWTVSLIFIQAVLSSRHTLPCLPLPHHDATKILNPLCLALTPFNLCTHDPLQNRTEISCFTVRLPYLPTNPMEAGAGRVAHSDQCLAQCSLNTVNTLGPERPRFNPGLCPFLAVRP